MHTVEHYIRAIEKYCVGALIKRKMSAYAHLVVVEEENRGGEFQEGAPQNGIQDSVSLHHLAQVNLQVRKKRTYAHGRTPARSTSNQEPSSLLPVQLPMGFSRF